MIIRLGLMSTLCRKHAKVATSDGVHDACSASVNPRKEMSSIRDEIPEATWVNAFQNITLGCTRVYFSVGDTADDSRSCRRLRVMLVGNRQSDALVSPGTMESSATPLR